MFSSLRSTILVALLLSVTSASAFPGLKSSADPEKDADKNAAKAEALFEKGHVALDKKNTKVAEASYRQCVALAPREARYHRQLGLLLIRTGRGQEAERELRISMHLDPTDWRTLLILGHSLHAARRFDEEIEIYRKTLEILPPEEKAVKEQLQAFIKTDEIAQKQALEEHKKRKEEEEKPFKNAY